MVSLQPEKFPPHWGCGEYNNQKKKKKKEKGMDTALLHPIQIAPLCVGFILCILTFSSFSPVIFECQWRFLGGIFFLKIMENCCAVYSFNELGAQTTNFELNCLNAFFKKQC